jgi:imidazolonepropionase-like amidohydrolase
VRSPSGPFLVVLALAGCHHVVRSATPAVGDLWIRDVTVVSPERAEPLAHAHVLVRGGRIVRVDTSAPPETAGTIAVDGAGRWLVPGLIDGHVHLMSIPGLLPTHAAQHPELAERYFQQLPRSYLYFGFTAVVDLNVVDREGLEALRKAPLAPEIFDCGNGLALANGYPMSFLPPEARFNSYPNFLYDPRQAKDIPPAYRPDEHTPAAAVDRAAAGGAICIKSYWERGFGPDRGRLPTPTEEQMRDVLAASHRHHLPLLLHANSLAAHRFAVATTVDAVAHGLWNWDEAKTAGDRPPALPDEVRRVLDDERATGLGYMPTSRVIGGLEDLFADRFLDEPALTKVLPAALLPWYRTEEGRWFARETAQDFEGLPTERIRQILRRLGDRGRSASAYFAAHGGRLLFGSDTPSAPTYANPPGYNGYLEMLELERAGIAPRRILEAATRENAQFFGLARDYGTIEPGKKASLLLLRANPLESVTAFDNIEIVILPSGRVVPRAELAAH